MQKKYSPSPRSTKPKVDEVNAESFIVHKFLLPYHSPINNSPSLEKAL